MNFDEPFFQLGETPPEELLLRAEVEYVRATKGGTNLSAEMALIVASLMFGDYGLKPAGFDDRERRRTRYE